jgi:hypothetical protein
LDFHFILQIVSNVINETTRAAHDNVYAFSQTSLYDIIKDFSQVSPVRVVLGYVLMVSGMFEDDTTVQNLGDAPIYEQK